MSFQDIEEAHQQGDPPAPPKIDASAAQFGALHDNTLTNLKNLTTACTHIANLTSLLGTRKDNSLNREKLQTTIEAARDIAKSTAKDVRSLLQLSARDRVRIHLPYLWSFTYTKQSKRQAALRAEDELERALKRLKDLSEAAAARERSAALPSADEGDGVRMVPLGRSAAAGSGPSRDVEDDVAESERERSRLVQKQKLAEFQLLENEHELQHALIVERDAQVRDIENTVLEVNDIFGQLARATADQSQIVGHIAVNIEQTAEHTSQAVAELQSASAAQRSSRSLTCCLLLIVLCVGAAAVLAAYVSLKVFLL